MPVRQTQGGKGPEEILERRDSTLATRLRATATLRREETVEIQWWGTGSRFPGRIVMEKREGAIVTASKHRQSSAIWTDGSRLDSKKVGAAVVWRLPDRWAGRRYHLGKNK